MWFLDREKIQVFLGPTLFGLHIPQVLGGHVPHCNEYNHKNWNWGILYYRNFLLDNGIIMVLYAFDNQQRKAMIKYLDGYHSVPLHN